MTPTVYQRIAALLGLGGLGDDADEATEKWRRLAQFTEQELLEQARGGDRRALDALIYRHDAMARRRALFHLRNHPEVIDDVLNDARFRMIQKIPTFRGEPKVIGGKPPRFWTYYALVIRSAAIDTYRSHKAQWASEGEMPSRKNAEGQVIEMQFAAPEAEEPEAEEPEAEDPDEEWRERRRVALEAEAKQREAALVAKALWYLGDWERHIILLAGEGLSYKQMAGKLGIPINTVGTRLNRARQKLLAAIMLAKQGKLGGLSSSRVFDRWSQSR